MTEVKRLGKRSRRGHSARMGELLFAAFSVLCLLLILFNSEDAIAYIHRGLLLCARTVIPSLFPFMVLSELMMQGEIEKILPKKLFYPLEKLFHLPPVACCAIVLGMVCGFPVGAKCLCLARERGAISKRDVERGLALSANPSSAFLISATGISLWESRRFGVALYLSVLASALLYGVLSGVFEKKQEKASPSPVIFANAAPAPRKRGAMLFTNAVSSATMSMLLVCAYILFFSALMGTLSTLLEHLDTNASWNAGIFCIFELSGGMSAAAGVSNAFLGALLSAFAAGWAGISVHCQMISVSTDACKEEALSYRAYFLGKLLQGVLCALLFAIILWLCPSIVSPFDSCQGKLPWQN